MNRQFIGWTIISLCLLWGIIRGLDLAEANFVLNSVVSKRVISLAPLTPFLRLSQYASKVLPIGVMAPKPVMTTLFIDDFFLSHKNNRPYTNHFDKSKQVNVWS